MPDSDATPPSPQSAEDLAEIMEIGPDLTMWDEEDIRIIVKYWPTIRAALARERELREALGELVEALDEFIDYEDEFQAIEARVQRAKEALLAQPVAGKERERG